jgi:hypothetical protein
MTNIGDLYDQDFFLWTQQQATALRALKKSNLPLDWDNLAEEIESLEKAQRGELGSQIRRILRHLFKLEASPATNPQAGSRATIREVRVESRSSWKSAQPSPRDRGSKTRGRRPRRLWRIRR